MASWSPQPGPWLPGTPWSPVTPWSPGPPWSPGTSWSLWKSQKTRHFVKWCHMNYGHYEQHGHLKHTVEKLSQLRHHGHQTPWSSLSMHSYQKNHGHHSHHGHHIDTDDHGHHRHHDDVQ